MRQTARTLLYLLMGSCVSAFAVPDRLSLSDGFNNRDLTLSPDGQLLATTLVAPRNQLAAIIVYRRVEEGWGDPFVAPFSGEYNDIEPMFSPDGDRLYFASRRPHAGNSDGNWDIWFVPVKGGRFGTPAVLPPPVNSPASEYYPSVTRAGVLYFTAAREDSVGKEDIYRSWQTEAGDWQVENVGGGVNTAVWEFNAFIAPDETFLVFTSQGREDDLGAGDLYVSYRNDGIFGPARHLGGEVNSERLDYCPGVYGGKLYFTSERLDRPPESPVQIEVLRRHFSSPGNGMGDLYVTDWKWNTDNSTDAE